MEVRHAFSGPSHHPLSGGRPVPSTVWEQTYVIESVGPALLGRQHPRSHPPPTLGLGLQGPGQHRVRKPPGQRVEGSW